MNSKKYINFLKTVDKLPREYYSIIREGILQINDDKKELLEVIVELKDRIDKAIEKLYCWGEVLDPDFQKEMLSILKGEYDEKNNK